MEATGIKIYNDTRSFNEWEFIYDPPKSGRADGGVQNSLQQPVMPAPANMASRPGQQSSAHHEPSALKALTNTSPAQIRSRPCGAAARPPHLASFMPK